MKESNKLLIKDSSKLTININGYWTAFNFAVLFESLDKLYQYYLLYDQIFQNIINIKSDFATGEKIIDLPAVIDMRKVFYIDALRILKEGTSHMEVTHLTKLSNSFFKTPPLEISKIKFSSPGSIDIVGLGKIFEVVKDFVFYYLPNKNSNIQSQLLEKDLEIKEQELIRIKVENLRSIGFTNSQIQTMIGLEYCHIERLKDLNKNRQIISVDIVEENK